MIPIHYQHPDGNIPVIFTINLNGDVKEVRLNVGSTFLEPIEYDLLLQNRAFVDYQKKGFISLVSANKAITWSELSSSTESVATEWVHQCTDVGDLKQLYSQEVRPRVLKAIEDRRSELKKMIDESPINAPKLPEDEKNLLKQSVNDAIAIIRDQDNPEKLLKWVDKENRKTVRNELERRLKELNVV